MGKRGRPAGVKDAAKRSRRSMTETEKQTRKDNKSQQGNALMTTFLSNNNTTNDELRQNANASPAHPSTNANTEVTPVTLSDNANIATDVSRRRDIVANLDEEDDGDGYDSGEDDIEEDETRKGIQQEYLECVHARLKLECNVLRGRQQGDWLVDYLKDNGWWIRKEYAPKIAKKLHLDVHHHTYYRDVRVWIPDLQYGKEYLPPCPCCKSKSRVTVHGFNFKHYGRIVVGLNNTYYIISRRYRCDSCKEKNKALKRSVIDAFQSQCMDVDMEKGFQYTFMAWNEHSLPLLPGSLSEEFPAFLTRKSGIDKTVLDLMFPLINKGMRPQAISNLLLELHSKEYTRCHIRYEEDNGHKSRLGVGFAEYSQFDDDFAYRGKVPTRNYVKSVYIKRHRTIRRHLANEVKKRGAERLSIDASFKSAKHMCQYKGEPIFKGLVTATNEFGEIRMQFHVVSDSHEQMEAAFESFLKTTDEYGYPSLNLVSTDNPSKDKAFLLKKFPSLREHQERMDMFVTRPTQSAVSTPIPLMPYNRSNVKVLSKSAEMNRYMTAMRNIIKDTTNAVAVDAEWKVDLTSRGTVKKSHKVSLIQFCFLDSNGVYKIALVRTHKLKRLPSGMDAFFRDDSITIVGVQVGGDLAKIGRDFKLSEVMDGRKKGSVINLGGYARDRDVVQNGKIGLAELALVVLEQRLEKHTHLRFSDWDQDVLSLDQEEYGARDALASMRIFDVLKTKPNLHSRLQLDEANVGKRVDVVPRSGSISCMATRAATGTIVDLEMIDSPDGVIPKVAKPGKNSVVVHIEKIYSPSLKVPRFKNNGAAAIIQDFEDKPIVLPIQMLKEHVASETVRATPENGGREHPVENQRRVSPPSSQHNTPHQVTNETEPPMEQPHGEPVEEEQDASYSITEVEDFEEITTLDCENLRCAIFCADQSERGSPPLECNYLDPAPSPGSIQDKFSSVLGDCFHAMDRPNIPVKHEHKKGYKNALKNAFFIWNETTMNQVVERMKQAGMQDEEIETAKYFRPTIFHDCVERIVPTPKILYWRVRAVFALYGQMKDSKTKASLFNAVAWKKANNVLREILSGYYSDPPGVQMYMKRVDDDGCVLKNKYDIDVIECMRGTPRTEAVHKGLVTTFGGWNMGVEMSSYVIAWYRHCYNHRC